MTERRPLNANEVLAQDTQDAIERARKADFWDFWAEKFIAVGNDPQFVIREMDQYRQMARLIEQQPRLWPEGVADFQGMMMNVLSYRLQLIVATRKLE